MIKLNKALVIGKFLPIHKGHIELVEFAKSCAKQVVVWLCISKQEDAYPEHLRIQWVKDAFKKSPSVTVVVFYYDEKDLPSSSEPEMSIARPWAAAIQDNFQDIDCIVSSEQYGDNLSNLLGIHHIEFNPMSTVHATDIRKDPYKHWDRLTDSVKRYYQRKVCVVGTESTGKTTLVKTLSAFFNAPYVAEVGRDLIKSPSDITKQKLEEVAVKHFHQIIKTCDKLTPLVFVDTDVNITKSYAQNVAGVVLDLDSSIDPGPKFDLYLYLCNDVAFVQDGTRLDESVRNRLDSSHRFHYAYNGIEIAELKGSHIAKLLKAIQLVQDLRFR